MVLTGEDTTTINDTATTNDLTISSVDSNSINNPIDDKTNDDNTNDDRDEEEQSVASTASRSTASGREYLSRIKEETDRLRQKRGLHHQQNEKLDLSQRERRKRRDPEGFRIEEEGAGEEGEEAAEEDQEQKQQEHKQEDPEKAPVPVPVPVPRQQRRILGSYIRSPSAKGTSLATGQVTALSPTTPHQNYSPVVEYEKEEEVEFVSVELDTGLSNTEGKETEKGGEQKVGDSGLLSWNDILDSSYRRSEVDGKGEAVYTTATSSSPVKSLTLNSVAERGTKGEQGEGVEVQIQRKGGAEDRGNNTNVSVNHNFCQNYFDETESEQPRRSVPEEKITNDLASKSISSSSSAIARPKESPPGILSKQVEEPPLSEPRLEPTTSAAQSEKAPPEQSKKSSLFGGYKMSSSSSAGVYTPSTDIEKKEHEAFCTKLIDEVFGKGGASDDKVPMDKVMMIIWQFRDDKDVIKFMTRFVSKYAGQRDVFDGIEFYLPQLAHMMIHLETEIDDPILEQFSLVIAQQSIHFALQLNWILAGAIEDYQPETPDGLPNPTHNPLFYSRCIKLLTNIERVVVYRRPRSLELQRLYEKGNISKAEMDNLERADRRFTAMQITSPENKNEEENENFGGDLMYKRAVRTSCFKFKRWKTRYFAIEERMLNCYNTQGGALRRSMPIDGATVEIMEKAKYPNMFRVTNLSFEFRIRASSPEDRKKWITMLEAEAKTGRVFGHTDASLFKDDNKDAKRVLDELTPSQLGRYNFYRKERDFVRRLTDIAEDLRFLERPERKKQAPGLMRELEIPESVYSPLMGSTDVFRRIHSSVWKETKVFNTKARCPTVMNFLGVRGEMKYKGMKDVNIDLAEYMHIKFNREISGYASADDLGSLLEVKTTIQEDGNEVVQVEMEADPHITEDKETLVVKKTVPQSINENEEMKCEEGTTMTTATTPKNKPMVWTTENHHESTATSRPSVSTSSGKQSSPPPKRGNPQLRKFLRESMISVPRRLVHHLERQDSKKNVSIFKSAEMKRVPIANGSGRRSSNLKKGDVYVGRSSVLGGGRDGKPTITLGRSETANLDNESIDKAKKIICGGETWAEKSARMLEEYENKPGGDDVQLEIIRFISKSNDDLRQEVFVMQMIHYYKSVFIDAGLPLWMKTYKLLSTSATTGLIEFNDDTTSIDGLKKADGYPTEGGMRKYFENTYGEPTSTTFKAAQRNFMESLAAYSIICYLLGLKDRHNGNIMIDMYGHIIHIDFGFAFGMNVGHEFTFERAPFKLTVEYVEVMGGLNGDSYKEFVNLFVEGLKAARKNSQIALGMIEIMMYKSNLPCFSGWRYGGGQALRGFRQRLFLDVPDNMVEKNVKELIDRSYDHLGTRMYDSFQLKTNGIAP